MAESFIGPVPEVEVGRGFKSRKDASLAKVHRPLQAGICGTKKTGAESIVVSGGYKDDEDLGEVIVYTGHGGRDAATGKQIADQSLEDSGNAALYTSLLEGQLVRVLRGAQADSPHAPDHGYRYDGLYRVAEYGWKTGADGYQVVQFTLTQEDSEAEVPSSISAPTESTESERVGTVGPAPTKAFTAQRPVRNTKVTRTVKEWHGGRCQLCGITLTVPSGVYSEGAHIQALGAPHHGPDITSNVLCLCPNCHVQFDTGAVIVTDDLLIVRNGVAEGQLITVPKHKIGIEYLQSHRARWGK
ncbi:HNH endonuclease [Nocardiopsis flavescens]|nr:HNH endonuclease [Nocardiopsis flavescens]